MTLALDPDIRVLPRRRTPERLAYEMAARRYADHLNSAARRNCACRDGGWCPRAVLLDEQAGRAHARALLAEGVEPRW